MNVFETTPAQKLELYTIATAMASAGLPPEFITNAVQFAESDQGFFDLMKLWNESSEDPGEREELIHAMQEELDEEDELPVEPVKRPYINDDELSEIGRKVLAFKARLKNIIDRDHGGVTQAAETIGMPQPSLSRFLSSPSMPRRTTLYKIANKLGLPESEIVTEWIR